MHNPKEATALDPADLESLRAAADMLSGLHRLILTVARRLEGDPSAPDTDEPDDGPGMLGSELRCVVEDTLRPAGQALEKLLGEWTERCGVASPGR